MSWKIEHSHTSRVRGCSFGLLKGRCYFAGLQSSRQDARLRYGKRFCSRHVSAMHEHNFISQLALPTVVCLISCFRVCTNARYAGLGAALVQNRVDRQPYFSLMCGQTPCTHITNTTSHSYNLSPHQSLSFQRHYSLSLLRGRPYHSFEYAYARLLQLTCCLVYPPHYF